MVITGVMMFVETRGKTKITELYMAVFVTIKFIICLQHGIEADLTSRYYLALCRYSNIHFNNDDSDRSEQKSPMDEPKLMYSFNCHYTLSNIEPCHVLGKRVVLYEHGHEISTREKFHD